MLPDQRPRRFRVVVVAEHEGVRDGDRARLPAAEGQHAAVVAALEREDLLAARVVQRERERHQVRLGARVGEAHELHRLKAPAQQLRQLVLELVRAAEADPAVERVANRVEDHRIRVAVQPRRVLAEQIDVAIAVQRPQVRTLAAGERERERIEVQDAARVTARQHGRRPSGAPLALGVACPVAGDRAGQGRVETHGGLRHGASYSLAAIWASEAMSGTRAVTIEAS